MRQMSIKRKVLMLSSVAFLSAGMTNTAHAADPANSWDYDLIITGDVSKNINVAGKTVIDVANGNAIVMGNADIYDGHKVFVNGQDEAMFAYVDNRDNIDSVLSGTLKSNMTIAIVDKDGLFFTEDSVINVGSLIATTSDNIQTGSLIDISQLEFSDFADGATIQNEGRITASEGGLVALVSPVVINSGRIIAKAGQILIGSGETATLDLYGDGLVELAVDGALSDALVENTGRIIAQDGYIEISVADAVDTLDNVVNNEGVINTYNATATNGEIVISAASGTVRNAGRILSDGDITIASERVLLEENTSGSADFYETVVSSKGGDVNIETSGDVEIDYGSLKVTSGSIDVDNEGGFFGIEDSLRVVNSDGTGSISVRQNDVTDATIQNAVDAILNRGSGYNTVTVGAGTYEEAVEITTDNFNLLGANQGVLGYSESRGDESFILSDDYGIYVDADNVTIDGFEIDSKALDGDDGILVENANNIDILNNKIIADGAMYWRLSQTGRGDNGIETYESDNVYIYGNDILEANRGIVSYGGSEITVESNVIAGEGYRRFRDGIYAANGVDGWYVYDNTIHYTENDAIEMEHGLAEEGVEYVNGDVEIVGNTVIDAGGNTSSALVEAIHINTVQGSVLIEDNEVQHVRGYGIKVTDVTSAQILNNLVQETYRNGLLVGGEVYLTSVLGNTFIDAGVEGGAYAMAQFDTGIVYFGSGDDGNSFVNTTEDTALGLSFSGADTSLLGNTLGSISFEGFDTEESYFIVLNDGVFMDGSNSPIEIDASDVNFDSVLPSSFAGGEMPEVLYNAIEGRIYDADDGTVNERGQLFVGTALAEEVTPDEALDNFEDFIQNYEVPEPSSPAVSLTITSLPFSGITPENIEPDAGDDGEDVAGIEPASGDNTVGCSSDAGSGAEQGSVTYNFGGSAEESVAGETECDT